MTRKKQLVRNIAAQLSLVIVTSLLIYCQEEKERERESESNRPFTITTCHWLIDGIFVQSFKVPRIDGNKGKATFY